MPNLVAACVDSKSSTLPHASLPAVNHTASESPVDHGRNLDYHSRLIEVGVIWLFGLPLKRLIEAPQLLRVFLAGPAIVGSTSIAPILRGLRMIWKVMPSMAQRSRWHPATAPRHQGAHQGVCLLLARACLWIQTTISLSLNLCLNLCTNLKNQPHQSWKRFSGSPKQPSRKTSGVCYSF